MKSAAMRSVLMKLAPSALAVLSSAVFATTIPFCGAQSESPAALDKTKSIAGAQHEIVVLLIKQKEFPKAAAEANKIFEMRWPEDQEPLLLKELLFLSGQFLTEGQASLGLQVIEKNSRFFKRAPSQIAILKEKGYLYKNMNQHDKAIDCFRKAQELEDKK